MCVHVAFVWRRFRALQLHVRAQNMQNENAQWSIQKALVFTQ